MSARDAEVMWFVERAHDFEEWESLLPHLEHVTFLDAMKPGFEEPDPWDGPAVLFGSLRLLTRLGRRPEWAHALCDHHASLRCSNYLRYVYHHLARDVFLTPMSALERASLFERFGHRLFVRPDANTKPFEARILTPDTVDAFLTAHAMRRDDLIAVSEVIDIVAEWRVVCARGEVITHSSYPSKPYTRAPEDVLASAREVSQTLSHAALDLLTVDIARRADDSLALIEVGGVCSWGLYGGSRTDYIEAMNREARERFFALA